MRRIDVMTRTIPYIPLFLALSTSSPFWESRRTGLKGYRLAAYDELPRTGLPELFRCHDEYADYISSLILSGVMPDATHIWWAIRPSHTYPTLELRVADSCTRIDDAIALAALYRALVRYLYRYPEAGWPDGVIRAIALENKWRAQRYGVEASFATRRGAVSLRDTLDDLIDRVGRDAEALGCLAEVLHCRRIVAEGTSADRQLDLYRARGGAQRSDALAAVNRWIVATTLAG